MKFIKPIVLTITLAFAGANSFAQKVDDILAKYFENTGGLSNWKKLTTMNATGKMAFGPQEFNFELKRKAPAMSRVDINVQGQKIIQACDGTTAWMINPFQGGTEAQKVSDEEAKEILDEKFEDEFIDYKKKGHEVTLEGEQEIDGVKCFKIKIIKNKNNDKEDVTEYHYFDSENYVPIMVTKFARSGPMKGSETNTYISDYQEVEGLMLPFFIETKVNGQSVQKMTMEKYALNQPVEDALFAFPKK